jgi:transposase
VIQGPGSEYDAHRFEEVLNKVIVKGPQGRPRTKPSEVVADTGYDDKSVRDLLRKRGIKSSIPINERNRKNPKRGRSYRFDEETYAKRSGIERFFSWIKMGFRRLILRYERSNTCYMGLIHIACFLIYWREIMR